MTAAGATGKAAPDVGTALVPQGKLGWLSIVRLGLVQAALGSVVVLVTSTLNRVMVVEYALPALLPGVLVGLHYAVQLIRPRFGYGSDRGGRRTAWIVGGMAVLALGGVICSIATVLMARHFAAALVLAVVGYTAVGLGVGAAGTSLLVLMAQRVEDRRRAAAATIMWILMIAGFAITSTTVGHFLDPFSPQRLIRVTGSAAAVAFLLAVAALWRVEASAGQALPLRARSASAGRELAGARGEDGERGEIWGARGDGGDERGNRVAHGERSFAAALRSVWSEPQARGFTWFVFVSMLAYSAQELLLEPFCGLVFGYSLGDSARLSGLWHAAAFIGMVCIGIVCSAGHRSGSLRSWTIGGCSASAVALLSLAGASVMGPGWPLRASVAALGLSNGVFAVAAIGSMMELAHRKVAQREVAQREVGNAGVRMGLWGAAQAVAFALGGVFGTALVDAVRSILGSPALAFAVVFTVEAALFFTAARMAARVNSLGRSESAPNVTAVLT